MAIDRVKEKWLNFQALLSMTRRKRLWVYPRVQLRIIAYCISLVAVSLSALSLMLGAFFDQLHLILVKTGYALDHPLLVFLSQEQNRMGSLVIAIAALSFLIGGIGGLLISNRLIGPMIRMHRQLLEMAQMDEAKPLSFRKGDFFQEIAEDYNQKRKRSA